MSLKVENIIKKYGNKTVVDGLSFSIDNPGVFALLGTNGAGKTTSIRVILGMLSTEEGKVSWQGKPLQVTEENVGYLAEERGLYPKINIIEQLIYFASLKGMKRADALHELDYWFERLNVSEYRNKRPEQLSKGNQQKIQLISALLTDPQLLILDEPLSGLDPVNADLFKSVIKEEIDQNKFIIMSSHQMAIVEEFCEDIVIMNKGKAVLQGNLNKIKKDYGRVNLIIKCESDITELSNKHKLVLVNKTPNESQFKVTDEEQALSFLRDIINQNIPLVKYELREPSLHELFVEKVGADNEN